MTADPPVNVSQPNEPASSPQLAASLDAPDLEPPIEPIRGTRGWSPHSFESLEVVEEALMASFLQAGYDRLRTPVLEPVELHARKSGAAIVSKLFEVNGAEVPACLRPEFTAGIVRTFSAMEQTPTLPWRVCVSGPVFRNEAVGELAERPEPDGTTQPKLREFHQVGVELLGASGPEIDAEIIWLADWSLARLGIEQRLIRLGDLSLAREVLAGAGLPPALLAPLIEMVSEGAAQGGSVRSMERGLDQLSRWAALSVSGGPDRHDEESAHASASASMSNAHSTDLERMLGVALPGQAGRGRRDPAEITRRLQRKWTLARQLPAVLDRLRGGVERLHDLRGPAPTILPRLEREFGAVAPASTAAIQDLVASLADHGVDPDRIELDLGLGRGLGFYSRMVFEIVARTPRGPVELGGGGRYDGLARVLGSTRDDRGVGFALGLERVWHVLNASGRLRSSPWREPLGFLVLPDGPRRIPQAVGLAVHLRDLRQRAVLETNLHPHHPEAQARAAELGVAHVVVVRGPWRDSGSLLIQSPPAAPPRAVGLEELAALTTENPGSGPGRGSSASPATSVGLPNASNPSAATTRWTARD